MASVETKLTASGDKTASTNQSNAIATATFAAVADVKHYVQSVTFSYGPGALGAGTHRATLAWTKDGVAQTLGVEVTTGVWQLYFGNNPIEGDVNTAITATLPASGTAAVFGEASLVGYSRSA